MEKGGAGIEMDEFLENHQSLTSVLACFSLALLYIGSLYIWEDRGLTRDHPTVIKRRMLSVAMVMLISPFITKFFISDPTLRQMTIWEVLGIRTEGVWPALTLPLALTAILFLGPLSAGEWRRVVGCEWDWVWLRNYVVAPLSEEWVFRACMMPLCVQCFHWVTAVLICPLWFGVAHAHHILERMRLGMAWQQALVLCAFQLSYTTLFGAYSALLFIKTGHLVAPFLAHSFCNMMGFPDTSQLLAYPQPKKAIMCCVYVCGVVLWCVLLPSLTNTALYDNHMYGKLIH